ncbi:DUF3105 domain-containing protein [Nocardioides sp.]|uniref:DUF3105 domain-containing protein n=1 Tax=Nocardioides sp. TaxID=35761 RepID=UPI0035644D00
MAKKPAKTERQAVIDQIRKEQKGGERRRGMMIVGVCVLIAVLILAFPIYSVVKDKLDLRQYDKTDLAEIGAAASVCQEVETKPANGTQDHVPPGTPLNYPEAPPAFGQHYDMPDAMARKFYTAKDRPELGTLVHNLEHGYTILWYDETIADDAEQMKVIRGIASKFEGTSNFRFKFKAVPWTSEDSDSAEFPEGQHIAYTHWSAGGSGNTDPTKQVGVWQYCSEPSGEALDGFMREYPYTDSPEPGAM